MKLSEKVAKKFAEEIVYALLQGDELQQQMWKVIEENVLSELKTSTAYINFESDPPTVRFYYGDEWSDDDAIIPIGTANLATLTPEELTFDIDEDELQKQITGLTTFIDRLEAQRARFQSALQIIQKERGSAS